MPSSFLLQPVLSGVLTILKCGTLRISISKKIGNIRTHFISNLNLILAKVLFQFSASVWHFPYLLWYFLP